MLHPTPRKPHCKYLILFIVAESKHARIQCLTQTRRRSLHKALTAISAFASCLQVKGPSKGFVGMRLGAGFTFHSRKMSLLKRKTILPCP